MAITAPCFSALLLAGETWNVSSLVGLIGLFGIAVQNGLVLVTQTRSLLAEDKPFDLAASQNIAFCFRSVPSAASSEKPKA